MMRSLAVSIIGKAKKPQVPPRIAPAMYTGRRPKASDILPTSGTAQKWMKCATSSRRRIRDVSVWTTTFR
ncbi:hypothetical protein D3C85_1880400 [compost metagenome]